MQSSKEAISDSDDLAVSIFDVSNSEKDVIIEGSLIKRNWYNKLQLRHFQMFKNGDIKYHLCSNGKLSNKGQFTLNSESKVEKIDAVTLNITIDKRVYYIIQPTSSQLNYQQQQEKGFSCFIDDWFREINKYIQNSSSTSVSLSPN